MKSIVLSWIIVMTVGMSVFAQNKRHEEYLKEEGDNFYREEQYALAIEYYRELVTLSEQQPEILYRLAESYRKTFNYADAEAYYLKTYYQAPEKFPLSLYYYALMLKLNGSFEESIEFFNQFRTIAAGNATLKEQFEQAAIDQAGSEMAKTQALQTPYKLSTEDFNSVYNDYAPTLRDTTTLVFTSGRVASNRQAIDDRYGEGFTDNYYFIKSGHTWQDKTRALFNTTNTKYNEGSGCFNAKGDHYYFTFCGKSNTNCAVYVSVYKDSKWSEPVALNENINALNTETKHPAISHGGDTLLFASNRKGGIGNFDIWMSVNSGNNNWGPAMNLGPGVNTPLNELAPAFTVFPHIFFLASDGHQNYGGLDLYMAKWLSSGTINLYNLDYPFNSNRDDCFITMMGKRVYFSSNRKESQGGFDIFSVRIPSIVSFTSRLSLKAKGARNDVNLKGRTETVSNINLLTARNEDRVEFENLVYEKRKIVEQMVALQSASGGIKRENFSTLSEEEFSTLKRIAETRARIRELEQRFSSTLLSKVSAPASAKQVTITGSVNDSVSHKPLAGRRIILMDQSGEVLKITYTNAEGSFRFTNVTAGTTLLIRLENTEDQTWKAVVDNLSVKASGNTQPFENIYFDFDHYTLRPEAKQILNNLAALLKLHPGTQVELYAYADDRGADDYNLKLTQKRGEAVLSYLRNLGVDQTALAVIAKGRQTSTTKSTEIQRQLNRKVEFYLNGAEGVSTTQATTYILKTKRSWKELASLTNLKEADLRSLNGASDEFALSFQPVRLPAAARIDAEVFYQTD